MASRDIADLHPEMEPLAYAFLDEVQRLKGLDVMGWDLLVYCTLRSNEEQAKLWRRGRSRDEIERVFYKLRRDGDLNTIRLVTEAGPQPGSKRSQRVTNALPGRSAHNYGLAIDAVPLDSGKALWGDGLAIDNMGIMGQTAGLEWAGTWTRFKERVHFQHPDWKDIVAR